MRHEVKVQALGDSKRTTNRNEIRYCCPFCEENQHKFYVNVQKGIYHCQKCKASGRIERIEESRIDKFREMVEKFLNPRQEFKLTPDIQLELPPHCNRMTQEAGMPYDYLMARGWSDDEIDRYKVGYCDHGLFAERIILPIYERGRLVYYCGRTYTNLVPKYMNADSPKDEVIFVSGGWRFKSDKAVIVEGVMDAISVGRVRNSIAILGKTITDGQIMKIRECCNHAVVMLDPDATNHAFDILMKINYYMPASIVVLEDKDPGDMSRREIKQKLRRKQK